MFLNNLFDRIKRLLISHVGVLVYFLDPVTTPQTAPYQKIKPIWRHAHFLFPVLYLCAIPLLYSPLRWMLATDLGSSSSSSTALDDSGRPIDQSLLLYFPAAFFPLKVWPQVDATFFIAAGTSAFVFITLVSGGTAAGFSLACNRYELVGDQRLEIDRKSKAEILIDNLTAKEKDFLFLFPP